MRKWLLIGLTAIVLTVGPGVSSPASKGYPDGTTRSACSSNAYCSGGG